MKFRDFLHFDTSKLDGISFAFQASIMHEETPLFCSVTFTHHVCVFTFQLIYIMWVCSLGKFIHIFMYSSSSLKSRKFCFLLIVL